MENGAVLLGQLVHQRTQRLSSCLPSDEEGRGIQLFRLIDTLLNAIDAECDRLLTETRSAQEPEQIVLKRKLLRLKHAVDDLHQLMPYITDVGRRDIPVGVLHLVDGLITQLLPHGCDPVIHSSNLYMYSTMAVLPAFSRILDKVELGILGTTLPADPEPVVFNIPSLDNANALLSPILAHEVGHIASRQHGLLNQVLAEIDEPLKILIDEVSPRSQPAALKNLERWINELICDALATVLTGPSFLFAAAVFLPAVGIGSLGSHPFPADRIRLALNQLHELEWDDALTQYVPQVTTWLKSIEQPVSMDRPEEVLLRRAVELAGPPVLRLSRDHVGNATLIPSKFAAIVDRINELLDVGIPPAEVDGQPVATWTIILASWLHELRRMGDKADILVPIASSLEFNAFVLKAVEMARLLELWEVAHEPSLP